MKEKLEFGLALALIGITSTVIGLILLGFLSSLLNKIFSAPKNAPPDRPPERPSGRAGVSPSERFVRADSRAGKPSEKK